MSDIDHHHPGCDNEHHKHHHHWDHHAPECDDQLPMLAHAGRGIKGDGFVVRISDPDTCQETYLEGFSYDEATKTFHKEWTSENINGGELSHQYNLRPFTDPKTFTETWIYRRPGRCEWSWTTPAIPYIWTYNKDGQLDDSPDHVVGSGVATIFVRASKNEAWDIKKHERLIYPSGTTRKDFNAPEPNDAWTSMITFGYGGDVELPNFDDIAKIVGCTKGDIFNILQDNSVTWGGIEANNIIDYINKCDKRDLDHIHKDLGFNSTGHEATGAFGGEDTVKKYIDKKIKGLQDDLDAANKYIQNLYGLIDDLISHIYGASKTEVSSGSASSSTVPSGKGWKITWNPDAKIPQGTLNVYGGDNLGKWIKTHENAANDDVHAR